ncbi:hypothetical protein [Borrelia hermsii]|uniref:Peptide methionine sulfoxide reductase n=3 Tax=Borrelia hermsii TaxID=140 RepID=A0AAN0X5F7_BORHE|nr:hypothetical protein [Borrelia hermsii]AAX16853.1 peptide methionine sulfoxide reductase [Borrelia hermsii DAH]AJW73152.1 hypothetical protein L283_01665 [Borrelia hermsii CC1]AMR75496.1 Peptide methionine sulfoxide reductase [Borrelia hermsii]ANA43152.1 hypothetical protein AXX13_01665 [Borrelia hermsii HS1]UCP01359.1 hypothetical protein K9R62_01690 [Borrelia hermsii]
MCSKSLLSCFPIIKRARFFYLYDIRGNRYLDLYLNGGLNFLGHRVQGLNLILKQTFSRGLTASYPSVFRKQFENILFSFFKEAGFVCIFKFERDAREFLLSLTGQHCFSKPWEEQLGIYEFRAGFNNFRYPMLVDIPMPGCMSISIAIVDNLSRKIEFRDPLDALTLAVARHMLAKILSYEKSSKINFDIFATPMFKLIGRYMFPIYKSEHHNEVFNEYLKNGYLISPSFDIPSLIPLKFSKGDLDGFRKVALRLQDKFGC